MIPIIYREYMSEQDAKRDLYDLQKVKGFEEAYIKRGLRYSKVYLVIPLASEWKYRP